MVTSILGVVLGLIWLYQAAGGTEDVTYPAERNLNWRLLAGVPGAWALLASAATWTVVQGRPARIPRRP